MQSFCIASPFPHLINIIKHLAVWMLLLVFFVRCERENVDLAPSLAVIEGTFDTDGYPVVLFSSSVTPGIDGTIKDNVINWGKVTISDGEREVILTGRRDDKYLPPYKYYTREMKGVPGKIYRLTAEFDNLYAESECLMPYPTEIERVEIASTESDSLKSATLYFIAPEDVPAYYYVSLVDLTLQSVPRPCVMGTLRTDVAGKEYSIPIMRPKIKIDGDVYIPNLSVGSVYRVYLNRVTKEVFEFWRAFDNMVMFSSSPFISSDQSLPSNIKGGYGVWSPQGSASTMIIPVLDD